MAAKIAGYSKREWQIAGVIGAIGLVGFGYLFVTGESAQAREQRKQDSAVASKISADKGSALWNCQRAIKSASRDPETANIPNVSPMQGGGDWRFLWAPHTEQVRMRNGLGLDVAVDAFCVVDEDTGKIKLLTLDGKQLVTPDA